MTNEEAEALGRRALAAGFKQNERPRCLCGTKYPPPRWPDFRDWATLGVLVGQVRERLSGVVWSSPVIGGRWSVDTLCDEGRCSEEVCFAATEAEAWVAALEAAP
jgi:hypothetical protein